MIASRRLLLACILLATLPAIGTAQVRRAQGSCAQITAACRDAGFVPGAAKSGNGLQVDCIQPFLQGTAAPRRANKPLPKIDPQVIAACKAQNGAIVENVDLCPTFEELAGSAGQLPNVDGASLVPIVHGSAALGWRAAALVEHHEPEGGSAQNVDRHNELSFRERMLGRPGRNPIQLWDSGSVGAFKGITAARGYVR